MLSSITPLGERGRQRRWGLTVTAYTVSSTLAAAALGGLLGALPSPSPSTALAAVAVGCAVGALLDLRPAWLPTIHRQVDEDWLHRYRGWVYGVGFGAQLGLGVVTIVTTAAVYCVLLAAALLDPWPAGALVGATFGFTRAVPALLVGQVRTTEHLVSVFRRVESWAGPARRATVALLGSLAVVAAVAGATA
jgi:hypothetical protein